MEFLVQTSTHDEPGLAFQNTICKVKFLTSDDQRAHESITGASKIEDLKVCKAESLIKSNDPYIYPVISSHRNECFVMFDV